MRGYDCLVVCADERGDFAAFVSALFRDKWRVRFCRPDELALLKPARNSEMGVIVIDGDAFSDPAETCADFQGFRKAGANFGAVYLTDDADHAAGLTLGDPFDAVICRAWRSAGDQLLRFMEGHGLRVQDRAFRTFLEHSVDGYWIWHAGRDQLEWSDRTTQMTGTPAGAVPRKLADFIALVHPQDVDRVEQALKNHVELGSPYTNVEMRLRSGDGGYRRFLANGQALRDEVGNPIILVGSLTDQSFLERVQQQLQDTQRRFTVLFNQMNDAAVLADIETGLIIEANQPAERLWGKTVAELVGSHQTSLHPPVLDEEARRAFARHVAALQKNQRDSINVPILRSDGTEVPTEISSSLIEMDGRMCILGVFRDIRERIRAERELRERDAQIQIASHLAAMGTLAAGVAHEINNPLTYVLGNIEHVTSVLDAKGVNDPDIAEALAAATTGGRFVRQIVSDLKAISRMDGADDRCDAAEVLRIATRIAMSDLQHTAQLDLDIAELPPLPISSSRLSQVVLNLLSNATRAFATSNRHRNRIGIKARRVQDQVTISISDNGVGIAPEDLKHIWEPFFTTRGDSGGTGLGLTISRRILQECGGTLEIESTRNVGTTVTITLPVTQSDGTEAGAEAVVAAPDIGTRPRLMVVDDDPLVSNVVERMLRSDFDITVHNSAASALADLESGKGFDVVLCDIMMPDIDGPSLHAQAGHLVPFLFLTGGAVTEPGISFEKRMLAEGRILYKPFETADLRRRLLGLVALAPVAAPDMAPPVADLAVDRAVIAELLDAMGRDLVVRQISKVMEQARALVDGGESLAPTDLCAQAHKIGGAANIMGLKALGRSLYDCESVAASGDRSGISGSLAAVAASLDALGPQIDDLSAA